jgi:hypothetical protein
LKNTHLHKSRRAWSIAVGAVGLAVAFGLTQMPANGSTPEPYITSDAVASQSMVPGSSWTSLGDSPLALPPDGKAAGAGRDAEDEDGGDVTSYATFVTYDPRTKQVLSRHRYGAKTEGKPLRLPQVANDNGTGGSSSGSGCGRVTVTQKRHDSLGLSTVGTWQVWTDWCWDRSNQVVSVNATGFDHDHDNVWSYDGVVTPKESNYYDFSANDGHPRSAYHFMRIGAFHGPSFYGHDVFWNPKNTLDSYYNGTWQWFTSS